MNTTQHLEVLAQIASMYYEQNMSQSKIGREIGYSPSMVSRLLAEAREQGIVEIHIHHPLSRRTNLENALREHFPLQKVYVLARYNMTYDTMLRRLGAAAAVMVGTLIHNDMTIGISWGTALAELVTALSPRYYEDVHVVQIIGSLGSTDPNIDGPELARRLARKLSSRYSILPVPLLVDSEKIQRSLMEERRVRQVLDNTIEMESALVGIGTVELERASLVRSGCLSLAQLAEFTRAGAVGDVCAIHFDQQGNLIDIPLQRRFMGVDYKTLIHIPARLGIAGGRTKAKAILGALRAGIVNFLVTDEVAATLVLELNNKKQPSVSAAVEPQLT